MMYMYIFFFYFHSQLFIFSLKKEGPIIIKQTKNTIEAELSQEEKIVEKHLHTEQKEREDMV